MPYYIANVILFEVRQEQMPFFYYWLPSLVFIRIDVFYINYEVIIITYNNKPKFILLLISITILYLTKSIDKNEIRLMNTNNNFFGQYEYSDP